MVTPFAAVMALSWVVALRLLLKYRSPVVLDVTARDAWLVFLAGIAAGLMMGGM